MEVHSITCGPLTVPDRTPATGPLVEPGLGAAPRESAPREVDPVRHGPLLPRVIGRSGVLPQRRAQVERLVRYGATSAVAFAVSEATLLILYGSGVVDATVAALIANLVGTVPSYLMSRYWIWSEAPRTRVGRQVILYWITSIACIAGTSFTTGAIANLAPPGHRFHLAVVGAGFLVVSVVFWIAKFVIYQRFIFPVAPAETRGPGSTRPPGGRSSQTGPGRLGSYGT